MSASPRLLSPEGVHRCCMCDHSVWAAWSALAALGWLSHPVGRGREPIVLCEECADLIAARRAAGLQGLLDKAA